MNHIKKKILIGVVVVIFGIIILSAIGSNGSKNNGQTATAQVADNTQTNATTEPAKSKQWVTVIEASGSANKQTDNFTLQGGKTKLTYTFNGGDSIVGAVYVVNQGQNIMKDGGIPAVTVTKAGTDSTFLNQGAGNYYLDIVSANTDWSVKVEEER